MTDLDVLLGKAGLDARRCVVRPAGAGRRNSVWVVEQGADRFVLRSLASADRLEMEVALLARCADADIPVPSVVWHDAAPAAMLQRALPGERLADVGGSTSLRDHLAQVARAIHAIPIDGGYGSLTADLCGTASTLSRWFTDPLAAEIEACDPDTDDAVLLEAVVAALTKEAAVLDATPPGLAQGDLQPENVLVDGDRVTGILDWEAAKSGPPALDFGWWDWWSDAFEVPWTTDALVGAYGRDVLDEASTSTVRRLVVLRIWGRELTAGLRQHDDGRALTARAALRRHLGRAGSYWS